MESMKDRFDLVFKPETNRRIICGKEVIIHCHHYNSRIQRTIESVPQINGKDIIRNAAEFVFSEQIRSAFRTGDDPKQKLNAASDLYKHLGYGRIQFPNGKGNKTAISDSSHFVEGWKAGFAGRKEPVCTFTEGYIQAAYRAIYDNPVSVREVQCMVNDHQECVFEISDRRKTDFRQFRRQDMKLSSAADKTRWLHSPTVDEGAILNAVVGMPLQGDVDGLIPAFNVYLANTPADFYNLVCLLFVQEMANQGLYSTAKALLIEDAETCGMNTFRGIMNSAEWDALCKPMVRNNNDNLFALIAISNALGWGDWHITDLNPSEKLSVQSVNGYEAWGRLSFKGRAESPQCFMLTGVSAGIMDLVYGTGSLKDRIGYFAPEECQCIACAKPTCDFEVRRA